MARRVGFSKPGKASKASIIRLAERAGVVLEWGDRSVMLDGRLYHRNQYYALYHAIYNRMRRRSPLEPTGTDVEET